jgi:cellulose synthase/poly-beta-1,6-N-acetylglucosamine synthase-like glycosyltransferase
MALPSVSIIICTYNSEKYLAKVLDAILAQRYPKDLLEMIVVDDNSKDSTVKAADAYKSRFSSFHIIVKGKDFRKGAAVSTNIGIKRSKGEIVCSIDSDAIISKNWIKRIVAQFKDKKVASVAGYINTANPEFLSARLVGAELEDRYARINKKEVDHVSTCNTAYRKSALEKVGGFDERIYYGYDVDLSYKLKQAGYKILLLKDVGCVHYWKESFSGYLRQQFNVAYGRLQLIAKHPKKKTGDKVSGFFLFMQVPLTLLFFFFIASQLLYSYWYFGYSYIAAAMVLILLLLMQLPQSLRLLFFKRDASMLLLPFFNLTRNFMWLVALLSYYSNKLLGKEK